MSVMDGARALRNASTTATSRDATANVTVASSLQSSGHKRKHENAKISSNLSSEDITLTTQAMDTSPEHGNPLKSSLESVGSHHPYSFRHSPASLPQSNGTVHKCFFCEYSTKYHHHYARHVSSCIDRSDTQRRRQQTRNPRELASHAAATIAANHKQEGDDAEERVATKQAKSSADASGRPAAASSSHSSTSLKSSSIGYSSFHSDGLFHCSLCPVTVDHEGNMRSHFDACQRRTDEQRAERAKLLEHRKSMSSSSSLPNRHNAAAADASSIKGSQRLEGKKQSSRLASNSSKSMYRPSSAATTSSKKQKISSARSVKSAADIDLSTGVVHTRSFPLSATQLMASVGYVLNPDELAARTNRRVYEVEAVRSRRFDEGKLRYEYLIKWLGWPESENTWESCSNTRCPELIQQYHIDDEEFLQTQIDDAMEMCSNDDPVIRFHRDGLCDLTQPSRTVPRKEAHAAEEWISKLFNAQLKSISLRDQMDVLEERGFVNFKMRQRGRYDLTIDPQQLPFMKNPPWLNTVKKILGGKAFLKHSGCMMSMPGSETQSWHSDGDHRDEATHLPCWMLNVFVPLVDMTRALGGTEFFPGSHVLHDEFIRTTPVTPLLKMGQVLLFDYRIRHRGMGNRGITARPVLYFSYAGNENIVDEKNFQKGRYLTLPPPLPSAEQTREQRHKERLKRNEDQDQEDDVDEEEEERKEEQQPINQDVEMKDGESDDDTSPREERKECDKASAAASSADAHHLTQMQPAIDSRHIRPSRMKSKNRSHQRAY